MKAIDKLKEMAPFVLEGDVEKNIPILTQYFDGHPMSAWTLAREFKKLLDREDDVFPLILLCALAESTARIKQGFDKAFERMHEEYARLSALCEAHDVERSRWDEERTRLERSLDSERLSLERVALIEEAKRASRDASMLVEKELKARVLLLEEQVANAVATKRRLRDALNRRRDGRGEATEDEIL